MPDRTFCNPVNINYMYQYGFRGRESADPAVVLFKGTYFMRGCGHGCDISG